MKKIISCFAVISCFVLGTTFSYAHNYEHHGKDHHGKDHHDWMKEMFAGIDANSDGMITTEEFNDFHSKKFKEMDANSDEKISLEEMQAGREKMHSAKHKRMDCTKPDSH